jgi:hypothetical protein
MRRRFFAVASAISLLAAVAVVVFWLLSYVEGQPIEIYLHHGGDLVPAKSVAFEVGTDFVGIWWGYTNTPGNRFRAPCWLVVCGLLVLLAWWVRIKSRIGTGEPRCVNCGYNLLGNTSGICPECGTPVPKEPAEKNPRPA